MTNQARERVAAWVKQIQAARADKVTADGRVDQQSLDRAADLEAIYQDMSWLTDMPEVKKRQRGRRIDPKSREQFAKWVKQTYGWGSHPRLSQLRTAYELVPILVTAVKEIRPTGEGSLRPLAKLRDHGYADHQAEVWQAAVEMAKGEPPTASQVRRAVAEFLERHKPPIRNTALDPRSKVEKLADQEKDLIARFEALVAEDNPRGKHALNEMIRRYKDRQGELRELRSA